jgi:hypothetical protein
MKKIIVFIFLISSLKIFSQELLSLDVQGSESKLEINYLEKILKNDIEKLEKIILIYDKDEEIKEKLENIKTKLTRLNNFEKFDKYREEILSSEIRDELRRLKIDMLGENPDALIFSGNTSINTSGNNGGNVLTPSVFGTFKRIIPLESKYRMQGGEIIPKKVIYFFGYNIALNIQSPNNGEDSIAVLNRLVRSGANGTLELGTKIGVHLSPITSLLIGVQGKLSWLDIKSISEEANSTFAYPSISGVFALNVAPFVIAIQYEWNFVSDKNETFIARQLDNSAATNVLIGINALNNFQIQFKYLLGTNKPFETNENLEIKLGISHSIL